MLNELPKGIKKARDLITYAKSHGGVLRCLPQFLKTVVNEKKTSSKLSQLELQLEALRKADQSNHDRAIQWLEICFQKLTTSQFLCHPLVDPHMKKVKEILIDRHYDPQDGCAFNELLPKLLGKIECDYNPLDRSWGFLDAALSALGKAADAIASFGEVQLFDGWAKVQLRKIYAEHPRPCFPDDTNGDVYLEAHQQYKLAQKLGHGIACWNVESNFDESRNSTFQTVYLQIGYLMDLMKPEALQMLFRFRGSKGKRAWLELCESDPVINYKFLILLSKYSTHEPATLPPKQKIESWEDVENYVKQADVGWYLSRFESENPLEHPVSLSELKLLVDRFLTFLLLNESLEIKRGPREQKEAARIIVRGAIEKKWNKLESKGLIPKKQDDLMPTISQIREENDAEVDLGVFTDSLIKKEVSKFARDKKFVAKRGADKGKRLSKS